MSTNPTTLILLGLVGVVALREVAHELRRRRALEWRIRILELLATAARRGLSLVVTLERAAASGPARLSKLCRELARRMTAGTGLSSSLAEVAPDCFPATCVAVIDGAEGTAGLADALEDLALRSSEHQSMGYRMRMALTYPAILAVVFLGAHLGAAHALSASRRSRGIRADADLAAWIGLGALVLGVLVLQRMLHRRESLGRILPAAWSRLVSRSVAGRFRAAGEFLSALSHVVAAGVPLPAAIRRVAGACGNPALQEGVCRAASALEEGVDPERAWRRTWLPELAVAMASPVARSSAQSHAEALQRTAAECRRRWLQFWERSLTLMPVLCVAALGVLLALDFAALYRLEFDAIEQVAPW